MAIESENLVSESTTGIDGQTPPTPTALKRGFASMDGSRHRAIASKGGSSVPTDKRSFSRDRELAVRAGRKGGQARVKAAALKAAAAEMDVAIQPHEIPATPATNVHVGRE
jgi:general stress protein YciG